MPSRSARSLVVACLLVAVAVACSSNSSSPTHPPSSPSTLSLSASASRGTRVLVIGSVEVERAAGGGVVTTAIRHALLSAAQAYVNDAVLSPLETGKLGRSYAAIFDPGIGPAATGPDRATLTDLAVGRTTALNEQATAVAVNAVADQSGALVYASTSFKLKVQATTPKGVITIARTVELTLQPVGRVWLIVAYRISVTRTEPKPTTRARPRTTTTRPKRTAP